MQQLSADTTILSVKKRRIIIVCLAALFSAAPFYTLRAPAQTAEASKNEAAAVQASGTAMAQLLKGNSIPLTIKASELTSEWRQVKLGQRTIALADAVDPTVHDLAKRNSVYYTKGETFSSGGETFMLAYRESPATPRAVQGGISENNHGADLAGSLDLSLRMPATAVLSLSLINLHAIGNINDIRAFDPKRDIVTAEDELRVQTRAANTASLNNLKQISLSLLMYIQDYDEKLPPMRSANSMAQIKAPVPDKSLATVQQLLMPYLKDAEIFAHPATHALYRPSPVLSQRALAAFDDPRKTISFYEAKPAADGTRGVAFLDGHVLRIPERDWEIVQDESDAATRNLPGGFTSLRGMSKLTVKTADSPPPGPPPKRPAGSEPKLANSESPDSPLPEPEATPKAPLKAPKSRSQHKPADTQKTRPPQKTKVLQKTVSKTKTPKKQTPKTTKKPVKREEN